MSATVVITGCGTLGAYGAGCVALQSALAKGELPLQLVDRSGGFHTEASPRCAALVPEVAYGTWVAPAQARRMSPPSRMAVSAARMALADAGWSEADVRGDTTAISLGTTFGCTSFTAKILEQVATAGPQAISPFLFMETVANAHAGQVALQLGARGSNATITQREASALLALLRGRELVLSGRARIALAGVVDEMAPLLHAALGRFGALARAQPDDDRERALPFAAARRGFLAAEGATVFVLEREDEARLRGAQILARLVGGVRAFDPTASTSDWGTAEHLGSDLRSGLLEQGLDPLSIEGIVAGANGARRGDRAEARALRACFATGLPALVAPKGITGEYGGGWLAAALLAHRGTRLALPAHAAPDSDLGIAPVSSLGAPRRTLMSALAAGGAAAWVVLERTRDG